MKALIEKTVNGLEISNGKFKVTTSDASKLAEILAFLETNPSAESAPTKAPAAAPAKAPAAAPAKAEKGKAVVKSEKLAKKKAAQSRAEQVITFIKKQKGQMATVGEIRAGLDMHPGALLLSMVNKKILKRKKVDGQFVYEVRKGA